MSLLLDSSELREAIRLVGEVMRVGDATEARVAKTATDFPKATASIASVEVAAGAAMPAIGAFAGAAPVVQPYDDVAVPAAEDAAPVVAATPDTPPAAGMTAAPAATQSGRLDEAPPVPDATPVTAASADPSATHSAVTPALSEVASFVSASTTLAAGVAGHDDDVRAGEASSGAGDSSSAGSSHVADLTRVFGGPHVAARPTVHATMPSVLPAGAVAPSALASSSDAGAPLAEVAAETVVSAAGVAPQTASAVASKAEEFSRATAPSSASDFVEYPAPAAEDGPASGTDPRPSAGASPGFRDDVLEKTLEAMCRRGGMSGAVLADRMGFALAVHNSPVASEALAAFTSVLGYALDQAGTLLGETNAESIAIDINYTDKAVLRRFNVADNALFMMVLCPQSVDERSEVEVTVEELSQILGS